MGAYPRSDEDDQYSFISLSPSDAATDSNKTDATVMSHALGFVAAILAPGHKQKKGGRSVSFVPDVGPAGPSHRALTEADLHSHDAIVQRQNHHDDDVLRRFLLGQGRDPTVVESWTLPPQHCSSVKSEYGTSTRSLTSVMSWVHVDHLSQEDDDIAAAGIWADVPATYYPEILLSDSLLSDP